MTKLPLYFDPGSFFYRGQITISHVSPVRVISQVEQEEAENEWVLLIEMNSRRSLMREFHSFSRFLLLHSTKLCSHGTHHKIGLYR